MESGPTMRIAPPHPGDEPPRLRDLWPLLVGPLLLGGVIFWTAYFVHIVRQLLRRWG